MYKFPLTVFLSPVCSHWHWSHYPPWSSDFLQASHYVSKTALVSNVSDLPPISVTSILPRIVQQVVMCDYLIPYIPRENLVISMHAYKATGSST